MMSLVALSILRRTLPASDLTWSDLAEQIAIEHGVSLHDMLWGGAERRIVAARRHLWGALRGAGYKLREISAVFHVEPNTVYLGVRLAARDHLCSEAA